MTHGRRGIVLAMAALPLTGASRPNGLDAYKWRKRVVLMFVPGADSPALAAQRREVEPLLRAPDDRDLQFIEVAGQRVTPAIAPASTLRRRFGASVGDTLCLLIGKDGEVKLRASSVITRETLSGTIDAMPMRRDEMQRR